MVPADKYMSDDLVFEVFRDPLGLIMFPNNLSLNNQPSIMSRTNDLIGDFNGKIFSENFPNHMTNDLPNILALIRNLDEDEDLNFRQENSNEADKILNIIENDYPSILTTFRAYKMPDQMIKLFTKKIISISIEHHNEVLINYFEDK